VTPVFSKPTLSNFLNARRGLSPQAMDRLLEVLDVDVLDLANPEELRSRALQRPERTSSFVSVPLVSMRDAALRPRIAVPQVLDTQQFRKRFLNRLKTDIIGDRSDWQRFVLLRPDASIVQAMAPRLAPGAVVLLDRHYNSLPPYRKAMPNLYAVRLADQCAALRRRCRRTHHSAAAR